jgi:hypothetical protein
MQATRGVAVVVWKCLGLGAQVTDCRVISDIQEDRDCSASQIEQARPVGGPSDLGAGVNVSFHLLEIPEVCASSRTVDVSGNGPETLFCSRTRSISRPVAPACALETESAATD